MPYTFGAAATDDVTWATTITAYADNRAQFWCGWIRPTTLTAGRYVYTWGPVAATTINGVAIAATTSELSLHMNRVTTDSRYDSSGVGLAVDQWTFVATLSSTENTGALDAWRLWTGTADQPPVERTLTLGAAGSGNLTGGSQMYVGNNGTASVAFQGDIAQVRYIVSAAANSATLHPLGIATSGVITNTEAQLAFERWVMPAYLGLKWRIPWPNAANLEVGYWSCDVISDVRRYVSAAAVSVGHLTPTVSGATSALTGAPRPSGIPW